MLLSCCLLIVAWIVLSQVSMKFRVPDKIALEKFSANAIHLITRTIQTGHYKLHYATTGDDALPTLFFVHGTPGSWMKFGTYLQDKDLLKKYRMVAVDRPGFGYSQFGDARNLEQQSGIISVLLQQLQNGKPIYGIGHSFGGPLITRLAVDNPETFSGLVLLAAIVDPATEKKYYWRPLLFKTPFNYLVPGAWRPSNKELWTLKEEQKSLTPGFSAITCPVHIVHGDQDGLVPVANAYYAQKMLVSSNSVTVTIIPGAGHYISDKNYKLVKNVLLHLNE